MLEYSRSYSASVIGKQTTVEIVLSYHRGDKILFPHGQL